MAGSTQAEPIERYCGEIVFAFSTDQYGEAILQEVRREVKNFLAKFSRHYEIYAIEESHLLGVDMPLLVHVVRSRDRKGAAGIKSRVFHDWEITVTVDNIADRGVRYVVGRMEAALP